MPEVRPLIGVKERATFRNIEINGHMWRYLEYGNPQGQPILNIHGWLGSTAEGEDKLSRAFIGELQDSEGLQRLREHNQTSAEALVARISGLEGKYHVVTPALPGFGTTAPLTGDVSLTRIVGELYEFQKATHTENAIVFGTSMGGIVATKLAARYPESTKVLVLQGTMTRPDDMNRTYYTIGQIVAARPIAHFLEQFDLTQRFFAELARRVDKDLKKTDPEDQERMLTTMEKGDTRTALATLKDIGSNLEEDMKRVSCPVVVLDGVHGEMVPIEKSHEVAKRFPTRAVFLPIGGHAGELGHALINRFPEGVAAWVDYVYNTIVAKKLL